MIIRECKAGVLGEDMKTPTHWAPRAGVPDIGTGKLGTAASCLGLGLDIAQVRRHLHSLSVVACHGAVLAAKATRLGTLWDIPQDRMNMCAS